MRHRVSECETLGRFARILVEEWLGSTITTQKSIVPGRMGRGIEMVTPIFHQNAEESFNMGIVKLKRLITYLCHDMAFAKGLYCVIRK